MRLPLGIQKKKGRRGWEAENCNELPAMEQKVITKVLLRKREHFISSDLS